LPNLTVMKENLLTFFYFINKLYQDRSILWTMIKRDLRARFIGSFFGFSWSVIDPLTQVLIYGVVFGLFFKSQPDPEFGTNSYILYLVCGILPWQFFAQSVTASTGSIVSNANLVKKAVGFPSEILPVIKVMSNLLSHLIGMLILILIIAIFHGVSFYIPFIFVYMLPTLIFAIGVGWIVAGLNVYLRDVQQVMPLVLMAGFFFTPIFYSPSSVPEPILTVLSLNPMFHAVIGYRYALLTGRILPPGSLAYLLITSFFIFGLGGVFFRKLKPGFAEVL